VFVFVFPSDFVPTNSSAIPTRSLSKMFVRGRLELLCCVEYESCDSACAKCVDSQDRSLLDLLGQNPSLSRPPVPSVCVVSL